MADDTPREAVTYTEESAFHALGLPDADDLVLRAYLLRRIGEIIRERGLTQTAAARQMGMDQPRVSALVRGQVGKFSTDRLLRALNDLGQDVELRIRPADAPRGTLRVAVAA